MKKPVIDPEFRDLIVPLTANERERLAQSIIADGEVRDALIVWSTGNILLDGHNRLEIADQHGIRYTVHFLDFDTRNQAMAWIINQQLGRRNVTPHQASYLRGKEASLIGAADTAQKHKMAERTIFRDARFHEALDQIAEKVSPAARSNILAGEFRISRRQVEELAGFTKHEAVKVVNRLGRGLPYSQAVTPAPLGGHAPPPDPAGTQKDAEGGLVPPHLMDVFAPGPLNHYVATLKEMRLDLEQHLVWNPYLHVKELKDELLIVIETIQQALPYAVHDQCLGRGCDDCRSSGWLTAWRFNEIRDDV